MFQGVVSGRFAKASDSFAALAAGNYAANDVVAADANTTATTPLRSLQLALEEGGSGYLIGFRITTNNTSWASGFRVDIYNVSQPTTALTGDNVAAAPKFANDAEFVDTFDVSTMSSPTGSDFRVGIRSDLRIPFKCADNDRNLYYQLIAISAETNEADGQLMNIVAYADVNNA